MKQIDSFNLCKYGEKMNKGLQHSFIDERGRLWWNVPIFPEDEVYFGIKNYA